MSDVSYEARELEGPARTLCSELGMGADWFVEARDENGNNVTVPQWLVIAEQLRRHIAMASVARRLGL